MLVYILQIASYLWEQNFLKIQSLICVPECISQRFDRLTSWMLNSSPPDHWDAPMGATLELQRQERLERMEDQMLTAALRNSGATINRQNLFHPQPLVRRIFCNFKWMTSVCLLLKYIVTEERKTIDNTLLL